SVGLWTDALWVEPDDYLTDPFLDGVEPELIETLLASPPEPAGEVAWAWRREVLKTLKEAHDAGVRLVAGSDPPGQYTFHGFSIHEELKWMVEAGLSPAEALLAATGRAAEMVGAAGDFGAVEPGRRADLLLLSRNPLDDITNTRTIERVILDGRVMDRERLSP
ncbi:MAG: amidohydrolase family protein, partial [Longimicrobiales bacterium]|nr:amidohydrolase family protein [Longimicrobiales bacterium]